MPLSAPDLALWRQTLRVDFAIELFIRVGAAERLYNLLINEPEPLVTKLRVDDDEALTFSNTDKTLELEITKECFQIDITRGQTLVEFNSTAFRVFDLFVNVFEHPERFKGFSKDSVSVVFKNACFEVFKNSMNLREDITKATFTSQLDQEGQNIGIEIRALQSTNPDDNHPMALIRCRMDKETDQEAGFARSDLESHVSGFDEFHKTGLVPYLASRFFSED